MPEENVQQNSPITEDPPKDDAQEKSTADSPPKTTSGDAHQNPPATEKVGTMDGGSKHDNNVVNDSENVAKNGEGQPPSHEGE
jgi:hypothetical protein